MKRGLRALPMRPTNEVPRASAQPINVTATGMNHQLATELTESLRRQLLWERSQKDLTINAVLKRRHTSHDVAHLKQHPERPYMNERNNVDGVLDPGSRAPAGGWCGVTPGGPVRRKARLPTDVATCLGTSGFLGAIPTAQN
ncbi:hypothetical protein B0T19DRAFT_426727 [Cercophora scortea]|uniref:DUF3295 domain-containing protein n=1 Tax=Cercophora scortea TaxID=314031 RepID=A0AAE0IEQ2_9PEZI|nr:hypothetical protein B0T19DRAFT_426727 [Cercophora scortea]